MRYKQKASLRSEKVRSGVKWRRSSVFFRLFHSKTSWFIFRSILESGHSSSSVWKPTMKLQLFAIGFIFLCISGGASALATRVPAASAPGANVTSRAARIDGRDASALPKSRRRRYISQNDMVAILDYHNKVRGRVFPPASNMEYMVSARAESVLRTNMSPSELKAVVCLMMEWKV